MNKRDEKRTKEIKRKFFRMLKENGALKAYIKTFDDKASLDFRNYWANCPKEKSGFYFSEENTEILYKLLDKHRGNLFINYMFSWERTEQGKSFWQQLHDLWNYRIYPCGRKEARNQDIYQLSNYGS